MKSYKIRKSENIPLEFPFPYSLKTQVDILEQLHDMRLSIYINRFLMILIVIGIAFFEVIR